MPKLLLFVVGWSAAMAQTTQLDPTQLKHAIKVGTTLPATCAAGDLFFKSDAQPGANLYGCAPANTWSIQSGFPNQICWFDATAQMLECRDSAGNLHLPVESSPAPTANQWVDYINSAGVAHTSQPTAAQVQNAVDEAASYSNPAWLNSLAWNKLSGVPASFNAGQLLGRNIASAIPNDLQYLGWNTAANQWEPKTLPGAPVTTVFGRSGAVTAQSGDYTTAQVSENGALYFTNARVWAALSAAGPLTFNSSTGQFTCPTCLTSNAVSSVFGRAGVITAQSGDYNFAQISGTAAASQLPTVAMRTDQSNIVSSGTQDFSNAAHTLPMKTGLAANLPVTCSAGETYFAADMPAGRNLYGCTTANTWTAQGGGISVATDGTFVGTSSTVDFITGTGLTNTVINTGTQINVQVGLDTAVVQTQSGEQGGAALLCASTTGSPNNYQCALDPTLSSYLTGMVLHWRPDANGAGGPTTLNVDQLGATPLLKADGVSNPGSSDIVAGQMYQLWYDGTVFRLMSSGTTGNGAVSSVFGRTGTVMPQAGDYTANQISGLAPVATSGSYADLANKPAIPSVPATISLLRGDGAGNALAAAAGTDYMTPVTPVSSSQLPMPGSSTLGGVRSQDCSAIGHVSKIGTDGSVTCSADAGGSGGCTISGGAGYYMPFPEIYPAAYLVGNGNNVYAALFVPTCTVTFSNLAFHVSTANTTSCTGGTCGFAVGIYSLAGTKLSQTVLVQGGSPDINSAGDKNTAWGSGVTLNAGTPYYIAWGSDSTTLQVEKVGQAGGSMLNMLDAYGTMVSIGSAQNHLSGDGSGLTLPSSLGTITATVNGYSLPPFVVLR